MKKEHKPKRDRRITRPSRRKQQHPADWVPVQTPPNFEEMFQRWIECEEQNVGWCMLCDAPICSADDLISDTNTHNCAMGREFEEKIRLAEAARLNQKPPVQPTKRRSRRDSSACNSVQEPRLASSGSLGTSRSSTPRH